jgi:hypothetical protein
MLFHKHFHKHFRILEIYHNFETCFVPGLVPDLILVLGPDPDPDPEIVQKATILYFYAP